MLAWSVHRAWPLKMKLGNRPLGHKSLCSQSPRSSGPTSWFSFLSCFHRPELFDLLVESRKASFVYPLTVSVCECTFFCLTVNICGLFVHALTNASELFFACPFGLSRHWRVSVLHRLTGQYREEKTTRHCFLSVGTQLHMQLPGRLGLTDLHSPREGSS